MKDNAKKKVYILSFFLCLSLIGNGILSSLYADNSRYKQECLDAEYTIAQLHSEVDDSYDEGYDKGHDVGYDEGYEDAKEKYKSNSTSKYSTYSEDNSSNHESSSNNDTANDDFIGTTVYITDTGSKYHRYGCQYLRQSCHEISISNAEAQGYTPCSRCW